ncbi:MAG TPA: hypothetical protein VJH68_00490 [Candidatus Nanoarchaeia archaeon]|nr:hypothetical protein [Candidatus Nanoarchaeia archaeon]
MTISFTVKDFVAKLRDEGQIDYSYRVFASKKDVYFHKSIYVVRRTPKGFISQTLNRKFRPTYEDCFTPINRQFDVINRINLDQQLYFRNQIEFYLQYYPNDPEHAEIISKSDVVKGGPSDKFPGAVAVLHGSFNYRLLFYPKDGHLDWLQYCFRQGSPPELTRNVAGRYLGAREHLLAVFLEQADQFRMKYITRSASFDKQKNRQCLEQLLASDKYY